MRLFVRRNVKVRFILKKIAEKCVRTQKNNYICNM